MADYFPASVSYTEPEGGMFIWVTLPPEVNAIDLLEQVRMKKVLLVPSTEFCVDGCYKNGFRVNYTNSSVAEIKKGIKLLTHSIQIVGI